MTLPRKPGYPGYEPSPRNPPTPDDNRQPSSVEGKELKSSPAEQLVPNINTEVPGRLLKLISLSPQLRDKFLMSHADVVKTWGKLRQRLLTSAQQAFDQGATDQAIAGLRQEAEKHANSYHAQFQVLLKHFQTEGQKIATRDVVKREHLSTKKRPNFTDKQRAIMREWLSKHYSNPYPSQDEKRELAELAGLTIEQVNNWFTNYRMRHRDGDKPKKKNKNKKEGKKHDSEGDSEVTETTSDTDETEDAMQDEGTFCCLPSYSSSYHH